MKETCKILTEIKKSSCIFKMMKKTESKAPMVKKVLFDVLKDIKENEPLPSIRSIAKSLGTAILPVHKAMTELKNDGIIIAKSTSGFLKASSSSTHSGETSLSEIFPSVFGVDNITLKFIVESTEPFQRSFWQNIINSECFYAKNPFVNIDMIFKSFNDFDDYSGIDIAEVSSPTYLGHKLGDKFLNIKNYFDSGYTPKQTELFDDKLIVPYCQTFFVYYNSDFINENNLPEPDFKNFNEQKNYFDFLSESAKNFNVDFFMGSCISPMIFLGKYIDELMEVLASNAEHSDEELRLEEIFSKVLEFCALFDYKSSASEQKHMSVYFNEGSMPFFIGNSTVYWRLLSQNLHFKWKAYPLFSADDLCIKFPIYTGIFKNTGDPLNAFQTLLSLLENDVQKKFADIGFIPMNPDLFSIESLTKKQNDFFKDSFKKVTLPKLPDYFQSYIQNSIFSPWMLEKAMNYQTQNYNFRKLFNLARAYFATHSSNEEECLNKHVI